MNPCHCFAPSIDARSSTLILGSMPGVRSLELSQYYGHPQNRFWPLLATLLKVSTVPNEYTARLQMLLDRKIALWDVLADCQRDGSLDSAITDEQVNDFPLFFSHYPQIKMVCFNGNKAYQIYKKYHNALLTDPNIHYIILPSTSPANARWRMPMLLEAWNSILH